MIEVNDLHKSYGRQGKINALNGISFTVENGEVFGVIGPDGAGKSSLFRILASLLLPDSGSATMKVAAATRLKVNQRAARIGR